MDAYDDCFDRGCTGDDEDFKLWIRDLDSGTRLAWLQFEIEHAGDPEPLERNFWMETA